MVNFLTTLNLQEYSPIFQEEGIDDLETLKEYSEDELKDLGVKGGHVKKILKALLSEPDSKEFVSSSKVETVITKNESKESIDKKIFFSYGHDHHAAFIQKIRQDLIHQYGLNIWIDNIELRAKADWERHIEKGIEDSDEIVYFLTPHSARRDDGYCLNELAYSCIYKKPIIPVMIDYVVPPLSIARVQYLDIENLTDSYDEDKYNNFLEDLVSVIKDEKELAFESDQFNLLNYLDPLDFSHDISKHLKSFVGREWLYEKVDDLLDNDESRVLWITAEAGFGKTSFSTYLMHKHKHTIGIHYCKYDNPRRKDPISVLTTLMYQISTQVIEYKDILNSDRYKNKLEKLSKNELDQNVILDELLIQPLNKINPNVNYFFIIDALDEAQEEGSNELADLIQKFDDLPSWLKIVVTSRPEPNLKRKLSKLKTIELDAQSEQNLDDLRLFIKEHENDKNCDVLKDEDIQSVLIEKSEGNILYLKEVIDSIIKGDINADEIMELPSGMTGLYVNMFERYFSDVEEYEEKVMPFFELLCASNRPLSKELIADILNVKKREFKKIIDSIGSLIEENENGEICFYHKSLIDWLTSENLCSPDYFVDGERGHEKILNHLFKLVEAYHDNKNIQELEYLLKYFSYYIENENEIMEDIYLIDYNEYISMINDRMHDDFLALNYSLMDRCDPPITWSDFIEYLADKEYYGDHEITFDKYMSDILELQSITL